MDFVSLLRIFTKIFDMAHNMPAAVLGDRVAEAGAEIEVGGCNLAGWPRADGEIF